MPTPLLDNRQLGPEIQRSSNLLTNGGLEQWQRGAGPFTATGAYAADRWSLQIAGTDTLSVQRTTTSQDVNSNAAAWITFTLGTGAGSTAFLNVCRFADTPQMGTRTLSLSIRVWASIANAVRIAIYDDSGGGFINYSAYHPGNSSYQTLTATLTLPTGGTGVWALVYFNASGTFYIDNAMLVAGEQPANYVPLHPADDLARCLRYYEIIGGNGTGELIFSGYNSANNYSKYFYIPWKAQKPTTPTVTKVGPWTISGPVNSAAMESPSFSGCRINVNANIGEWLYYNSGAGSYITSECNP